MRLSLLIICSFIFSFVHAEKVFDFTLTCQQAYTQISMLKLNAGEQLVQQARKENPDNLIPEILDSYIDFYVLFFNEDPAEYDKRIQNFEDRLDKIEEGPDNSPFYNFCRTVVYMQKASVEIKFGNQWSAGWDFRKAFSLIKENRKDFPSFQLNNLIYGPMLVAAGTIPDGYKWLASIFGIKGSVKDGVAIMQQFVNSKDSLVRLFFNEASFYYCYVLSYVENKPDEVFQYINQRQLDIVNNYMLAYMAANLAINVRKTDYAYNVISKRNKSPEYLETSVWDLEMGYVKLRQLQLQEAEYYFQRFTNNFKGKFYLKDAWQKLSWCYYLQGNKAAAENARQQVLHKGSQYSDADRQAYKDASTGEWPNMLLLKVRLLNDGGYNAEALNMLIGKSAADFDKPLEKLEFAYRVGRIYDDQMRDSEAIKMYQLAIKLGEDRTEYYAARAALQIGLIFEREGKKEQAIQFYKQCIGMKDHDYKDSLDQKAKAGIARCSGA